MKWQDISLKTCFGSDLEPASALGRKGEEGGRKGEEVVTVGKHGKDLEWKAVATKQISMLNYHCQGSALIVILAIRDFSLS